MIAVLNQLLFQWQDPARLIDPKGNCVARLKEAFLFGLQDYLIHKEDIGIEIWI